MDMIEKAARAIALDVGDSPDLDWKDWVSEARAVLEAIREPSASMIEAGFHAREYGMTIAEGSIATWQAMIDEILNPSQGV